ncbi:MAG: valine--tRNA ligase [Bradymonadales bacterium]|nr:valine--tRNA ligase [Bradymonadales bacterium]
MIPAQLTPRPAPIRSKQYDPSLVEMPWYAWWEENRFFHPEPNAEKKPHTIMIPLPNVTGALHLGHALNNSLQDSVTRCRRMQGFETLWLPGCDHAGIATQSVVERRLYEEEGLTRHDLGRARLLERIWSWKDQYMTRILNQLRRMGASLDWDRTHFTMSPVLSRAVRHVFLTLFREGLIYRGKRLINWSVGCQTALSNDELEYHDIQTFFWDIRYPVIGEPDRFVTVSTTRPETLLGDTAVAVHPADPRYRDLIGKTVRLPLLEREIPIIADAILADPEKGTGAVKVTPAHDFNDYECGLRHGLPMINILHPDGTLNQNAGPYQRLTAITEGRKRVLADLEAGGLLGKTEPLTHSVAHCYRSGTIVEPYLSDQWFVRMESLVELARRCYREGQVRFFPERRADDYLRWLDSTPDWCISRQIWWGHRIPIWYCRDCHPEIELDREGNPSLIPSDALPIVPDSDDPEAVPSRCPACQGDHLVQDPDVLDTWFSSQLWPLSTLGWPEQTADLAFFYPTNVLITARDILALWVARMIMMGMKFMKGTTPFHHVYIHGTILDETGNIMSKSRGNGFDPVRVIEGGSDEIKGKFSPAAGIPPHRIEHYKVYGADALRYGILSLTKGLNQNLKMSVSRTSRPGEAGPIPHYEVEVPIFEEGRRFANKIWQATHGVVLPNLQDYRPAEGPSPFLEDRWIISRVGKAVAEVTADMEEYRLGEACETLYHLFWDDFCSYYLEVVKLRLWDKTQQESRRQAQSTILLVLDTLLKLLHPIMPFLTEVLWQELRLVRLAGGEAEEAPAILVAPWPQADRFPEEEELERTIALVRSVITAINNIRASTPGVSPSAVLPEVIFTSDSEEVIQATEPYWPGIQRLAKVERFVQGDPAVRPAQSAAAVAGPLRIFVPLGGLIDLEAERARLTQKIAKLQRDLDSLSRKLADPNFLARAPAEVVEKDRLRLAETEQNRQLLLEQLASLQ